MGSGGSEDNNPPMSCSKALLPPCFVWWIAKSSPCACIGWHGIDLDRWLLLFSIGACWYPGKAGVPSSSRRPPISKKDIWRGVGMGLLARLISSSMLGELVSISSVAAHFDGSGNFQLSVAALVVRPLVWVDEFVVTGAGRGTLSSWAWSSGSSLMPISETRSASLPQFLAVSAPRRLTAPRSKLDPPVLPNLKRCFFAPRSRTKDPSTRAFETAAAASISRDATRERNCWSECRSMTATTR